MTSPTRPLKSESLPEAIFVQPASLRFPLVQSGMPTSRAYHRIGIAVDLRDESAHAVKLTVQNLQHGDAVILLHVRPTSVLYSTDRGMIDLEMEMESKNGSEGERFGSATCGNSNPLQASHNERP